MWGTRSADRSLAAFPQLANLITETHWPASYKFTTQYRFIIGRRTLSYGTTRDPCQCSPQRAKVIFRRNRPRVAREIAIRPACVDVRLTFCYSPEGWRIVFSWITGVDVDESDAWLTLAFEYQSRIVRVLMLSLASRNSLHSSSCRNFTCLRSLLFHLKCSWNIFFNRRGWLKHFINACFHFFLIFVYLNIFNKSFHHCVWILLFYKILICNWRLFVLRKSYWKYKCSHTRKQEDNNMKKKRNYPNSTFLIIYIFTGKYILIQRDHYIQK